MGAHCRWRLPAAAWPIDWRSARTRRPLGGEMRTRCRMARSGVNFCESRSPSARRHSRAEPGPYTGPGNPGLPACFGALCRCLQQGVGCPACRTDHAGWDDLARDGFQRDAHGLGYGDGGHGPVRPDSHGGRPRPYLQEGREGASGPRSRSAGRGTRDSGMSCVPRCVRRAFLCDCHIAGPLTKLRHAGSRCIRRAATNRQSKEAEEQHRCRQEELARLTDPRHGRGRG